MGKLEKEVEREVRNWVEDQGGIWLKLLADGRKGVPDNLIMLPPVVIGRWEYPLHAIIELKRPEGGILSPHQERWLYNLATIRQPVHVCDSLDHVKEVMAFERDTIRRKVLGARADQK